MNARRRNIVRAAALVSSVVVVAVYIGCRATSDRGSAPVSPQAEGREGPMAQEKYFGGSKSAEVFPAPKEEPASERREFFGGSKSAPVIRPSQPASQQSASPK